MLLLTGDIGGTKTILRLVEADIPEKSFNTIREEKYVSASFLDLVPMVQKFLGEDCQEIPESACFAIAGPVPTHCDDSTSTKNSENRSHSPADAPDVTPYNHTPQHSKPQ